MTTRHLVDPEILMMIDAMPLREFDRESLPQIRAETEDRFKFLGEPPLAAEVKVIDGPGGALKIYWFDPAPGTTGRPALLHIHGGGMIIGSASGMQIGPSAMALALGFPVASVEYRLAPETPFPGPQEDCLAALTWLSAQASELGIDPERIGIIGESAGAGLGAAVALMARDLGGPQLAAQFLIYPMLDHRTGSEDCRHRNRHTGEFIWTRSSNRFGWEALRGDYAAVDARKGWFSPSLADDLTALPTSWIGTGSLDLFFDEDLDYARRLVDAGVPVELHSYPGAIHGFNMMAGAHIAQCFNRDLMSAIGRILQSS